MVLKSLLLLRTSSKNIPIRFHCTFANVPNIHLIYSLKRTLPSRYSFNFDCVRASAHALIYFYRLTNHLWSYLYSIIYAPCLKRIESLHLESCWHGVELRSNVRSKARLFQMENVFSENLESF